VKYAVALHGAAGNGMRDLPAARSDEA